LDGKNEEVSRNLQDATVANHDNPCPPPKLNCSSQCCCNLVASLFSKPLILRVVGVLATHRLQPIRLEPRRSLADAVRQFGLRLVASKAKLDVLVIDKAKKAPTPN
jgi:hypothetical protein